MRSTEARTSWRHDAIVLLEIAGDGLGRSFANLAAIEIDSRHASLSREGNEFGFMCGKVAATQAVLFFGEDNDGAAFGSFVGQRGKLRGIGHFGLGHSGSRQKFCGLAVAEGDRAGLVEQQCVDIARSFYGTARHREHVVLDKSIHACDADG